VRTDPSTSPPSPPLDPKPPWLGSHCKQEGRYLLGPFLGQGGMGEVWEAWDRVLQRTVALKRLKKLDPLSLLRFLQEARIQSRLSHPNICPIFDVDDADGAPRIAMLLVRGPTLAQAAPELSVTEKVRLLAQVAAAVHAAHRQHLVHRDIKPSNILLERCADGHWKPYVCDFGLARDLDESTLADGRTVRGTPAFMAPEQIRGDRTGLGPATDIYALGGTLAFLLHGRVPRNPGALVRGSGLLRVAKAVPRELDLIAARCLAEAPADRYPSAAALAEDLENFAAGRPLNLVRRRGWTGTHGNPWRALLPAVLGALAVLAGGFLADRGARAREQRRSALGAAYLGQFEAMERALLLERLLPPHDLRPLEAELRGRLAALQQRLDRERPANRAPGRYALGRGRLLLGDACGACAELQAAWDQGFRPPGAAQALAQALFDCRMRADQDASVQDGRLPAPDADAALAARLDLLASGAGQGRDDYIAALAASLERRYDAAVRLAQAATASQPWPAILVQARCLHAQGLQGLAAGDLLLAEARFQAAADLAHNALRINPGDERLRRASLQAGLGLAALGLERGDLTPDQLAPIQDQADQALEQDPDQPDLQAAWLALQAFRAMVLAARGRDPEPVLDTARAFLWQHRPDPDQPELKACRMLIHWQRAEWDLRRGADPWPSLAQALADLGHTSFLGRDFLGDVLTCAARAEAAKGRDPRPYLDQAAARMAPLLGPGAAPDALRSAGRSWLLRARWEAAHGLDCAASLERYRELGARLRTGSSGW
jgi:hypothetical protein